MMTTVGKKHNLSAHPQVQRLNLKNPRQGVTCKTPVPTTNSKKGTSQSGKLLRAAQLKPLCPISQGLSLFTGIPLGRVPLGREGASKRILSVCDAAGVAELGPAAVLGTYWTTV